VPKTLPYKNSVFQKFGTLFIKFVVFTENDTDLEWLGLLQY